MESAFQILLQDPSFLWWGRWGVELKAVLVEWNRKPAVLNFLSDITERRQAEEALRESEEKYRGILESIEEGYYEGDLAGNMTFVNSAMSKNLQIFQGRIDWNELSEIIG